MNDRRPSVHVLNAVVRTVRTASPPAPATRALTHGSGSAAAPALHAGTSTPFRKTATAEGGTAASSPASIVNVRTWGELVPGDGGPVIAISRLNDTNPVG